MKNAINFIVIFLVVGTYTNLNAQNLEVEGEIIADSIDVSSGLIKNVADPVNSHDAATKGYVDSLLLSFGISLGTIGIQGLLNFGYSPFEIINAGADKNSLYGNLYQGGFIFYLDDLDTIPGVMGYVSSQSDQSLGTEWGCLGTLIGGTSANIGTGQANTTAIVGGCGTAGIAAKLCDDLVDGGYDDWFLPSKAELNEMYLNLKVNGLGGIPDAWYWSSTEEADNSAWEQWVGNGFQGEGDKDDSNHVRAIRAF